jgi:cancer susceptibility candidate protein 1
VPPKPAAKGSKKKNTKAELEAEKLVAEEEARKAEDARLRREEDER